MNPATGAVVLVVTGALVGADVASGGFQHVIAGLGLIAFAGYVAVRRHAELDAAARPRLGAYFRPPRCTSWESGRPAPCSTCSPDTGRTVRGRPHTCGRELPGHGDGRSGCGRRAPGVAVVARFLHGRGEIALAAVGISAAADAASPTAYRVD